jgi:hypothetical protein
LNLEGGDGWELITIGVAIGLFAYAGWQRHGPSAFVGVAGLLAFLVSAGDGSLWGWPVLLAAVAIGCFVWALAIERPADGAGAMPYAPQPPSSAQPPPP